MPKNIVLKISQKGAAKTGQALKAVTGSVIKLGAKSALVGAGFGVLATKLAGDFQKSLLEVSTLMTDVNAKTLPNMSRELRSVASASGLALSSISKAKYDIVSAGFSSAAESANVLAVASKLAVGGVTSAASAADILTTALNAYGKTSDEANNVADILFTTVRLGKTTMDELGQSMGLVLPFAKSMNLGLKGVGAAMATLTASGINTAEATTSLKSAIIGLSAPTDSARDAMIAAGIEVVKFDDGTVNLVETVKQFRGMDPATIKQFIPNVTAIAGIQTLANNFDVLSKNVEQFETQAAGATEIAFKKMSSAFNTQFSKLKNNMQNIMIEIGDVIIDKIQPSVTKANAILQELGDIGWDVIGATIADNIGILMSVLGNTFSHITIAVDAHIKLMALKLKRELRSLLPDLFGAVSDMDAQIKILEASAAFATTNSMAQVSKSMETSFAFIKDQAQQRADAEIEIQRKANEQKAALAAEAAEEIEKVFVRTDLVLRKTIVTAEDIAKAFEMIGASMEKVAVPEVPEGEYTQHIDFVTGMGVAFANSGEKSQEFWDNLTNGMQSSIEQTRGYIGGVSSLFENMYAHKKQLLDNDMNAEIRAVQKSGMNEEAKQAKINNIKEDYRQKGIDAQKKLKPIKYAQAISNTALGVSAALAMQPWTPANFVLAGIVAAAGAVEIATINAQPFASGGIVAGKGNQDTVPAMLTPGEVILNKAQQENLTSGMGGITLNISAPLVDEHILDVILPKIKEAQRMNLA